MLPTSLKWQQCHIISSQRGRHLILVKLVMTLLSPRCQVARHLGTKVSKTCKQPLHAWGCKARNQRGFACSQMDTTAGAWAIPHEHVLSQLVSTTVHLCSSFRSSLILTPFSNFNEKILIISLKSVTYLYDDISDNLGYCRKLINKMHLCESCYYPFRTIN